MKTDLGFSEKKPKRKTGKKTEKNGTVLLRKTEPGKKKRGVATSGGGLRAAATKGGGGAAKATAWGCAGWCGAWGGEGLLI